MNSPLVKQMSSNANPEIQELVKFFDETLGFCPNSVLTMQIRPEIGKAFINLNKAVMANHGRVTSALKRLLGYMSSFTAGCQYCQAHTIRAAERYEGNAEQLENIWDYKIHSAFNDTERVALDFAVAASSIPNAVTDQIANNLREHWDEGEIVEMLGVISLFGYLNRWNDSMGTEMEKGAIDSGEKYLTKNGWSVGKHQY